MFRFLIALINTIKTSKTQLPSFKAAKAESTAAFFFDLAELTGLNKEWLANELLGISLKTSLRYARENKPLLAKHAEMVFKLMALYKKGIEVFGDRDQFNNWLQKPAFGLGEQIPFTLLSMSTGIDLVMDELYRIEFGALA